MLYNMLVQASEFTKIRRRVNRFAQLSLNSLVANAYEESPPVAQFLWAAH